MDIGGIRTIERKDIYEPLVLQVLGKRGIDRRAKVVVADKALSDDIVIDASDECRLSRVCLSSGLVNEADAILVLCRRAPVLPLGRRDAPGIDKSTSSAGEPFLYSSNLAGIMIVSTRGRCFSTCHAGTPRSGRLHD